MRMRTAKEKTTLQKLLASIEASLVLNTFARWQPSLSHSDAHQTIAGSYRFCVLNDTRRCAIHYLTDF